MKDSKELVHSENRIYRWWRDDKKDIEPEHVSQLKERAKDIIDEMVGQGFSSGKMQCSIYNEICDDFLGFSGWWEVKVQL